MRGISYLEKLARRGRIERVAVVYPFTWANPFFAFPPIAAEYVQAGVVGTGREARLFDLRFENDLREPLRDADLVCLYGYFEDCAIFGRWDRHAIPEVLEQVPADTPVVAGGTGFSEPADVFAAHPKIDVVLRGNPDATIAELLEADELERVENIAFRSSVATGGYVETPRAPRPLRDDVYPRRHLRNPSYRYHIVGVEADTIRAGIGCDYRCRFCYQYGKGLDGEVRRWQGRSAESLYAEIREIDAPLLAWVDDDMTSDMRTLGALADLLIENGCRKAWAGTGRLDHVNRSDVATLRKLERAGLVALSFGVESLNERTLRFYAKGHRLEDVEEAMARMQETNILLMCSFLLGSPGETEADMLEMMWFGRRWNIDTIVTNRLRVAPGTALHQAIYDEGGAVRPGMERIRGPELKRIKGRVKFGQRSPFRFALSLAKLYRHEGLHLDPLYLLSCAIETAIRGSLAEKTLVLPIALRLAKRVFAHGAFRRSSRLLARILTPPLQVCNRAFDALDRRTGFSTRFLPAGLGFFRERFYERRHRQRLLGA